MPRGGARKGAGRKPMPLEDRIALNKSSKKKQIAPNPPSLLHCSVKYSDIIPTPAVIYTETMIYLQKNGYINLIPESLVISYALAEYDYLLEKYEMIQNKSAQNDDSENKYTASHKNILNSAAWLKLQMWKAIQDIINLHEINQTEKLYKEQYEASDLYKLLSRRERKKPQPE